MICRFWLFAVMATLVLWPTEVSGGPVDAIMAFFGLTTKAGILVPRPVKNKNQAPLVSSGEMERSSTQNWNEWMDFDPQFRAFRGMISIDGEEVDISKESADGDTVVCPQHEALAAALVKLEVKRKLVIEGWEDKVKMLSSLGKIIKTMEDEFDTSVLNCDINGESGESDCNLFKEINQKTSKEGDILEAEEDTIKEYAAEVEAYHCACTFTPWTKWGDCKSTKVVDLYDHCDPKGSADDCKAVKGTCGVGQKTRTRKQMWPEKNKGGVCDADLSEDVQDKVTKSGEVETHAEKCLAGKFDGNCPISCHWTEWNPKTLEEAVCPTVACDDPQEQIIYRKHNPWAKFGGKPCFGEAEKSKKCSFDTAAKQSEEALKKERDLYITVFGNLKAAMCKDGKGPCINGSCKVEISEDQDAVINWCTCETGWEGNWCNVKKTQ